MQHLVLLLLGAVVGSVMAAALTPGLAGCPRGRSPTVDDAARSTPRPTPGGRQDGDASASHARRSRLALSDEDVDEQYDDIVARYENETAWDDDAEVGLVPRHLHDGQRSNEEPGWLRQALGRILVAIQILLRRYWRCSPG